MREVSSMSADDVVSRTRLLENEIRIMRLELTRISHEIQSQRDKIRENTEKIKVNKTLPYLVSNVIEVRFASFALSSLRWKTGGMHMFLEI